MPYDANKPGVSLKADEGKCAFITNEVESTFLRLPFVKPYRETGVSRVDSFTVTVAIPLSYEKSKSKKYPVVILSSGPNFMGSAIEMMRGIAGTKEVEECIVIDHHDPLLSAEDAQLQAARVESIITWCRSKFRVKGGEVALLLTRHNAPSISALMSKVESLADRIIIADVALESSDWIKHCAVQRNERPRIAWSTRQNLSGSTLNGIAYNSIAETSDEGCVIPALIHGVRTFWSTGHAYGQEMMSLKAPLVSAMLTRAVPFIRIAKKLSGEGKQVVGASNRHVFRSEIMDRNFEIFVSLPAKPLEDGKVYPAVFALDANTTWSCVMETATRMSAANEIADVITIGIGVPRSEGDISFGLRRFEELSPPVTEAAFANPLGRFFLSIFAMFGKNARDHFGLAPKFHCFVSQELLPALASTLPMDFSRLYLVGHSAAGTYIGYEAAQATTPFKAFGAFSPGVAISDSWMLKRDGGLAKTGKARDILVTIGGDEKANAFNTLAGIPQSEQYASEVKGDIACSVEYICLDNETHSSVFPRTLALFLGRMFGNQQTGPRHV
ncbi:MAG: alpha/beta hydrolase-fold protein [Pseudomonadota bacterium]